MYPGSYHANSTNNQILIFFKLSKGCKVRKLSKHRPHPLEWEKVIVHGGHTGRGLGRLKIKKEKITLISITCSTLFALKLLDRSTCLTIFDRFSPTLTTQELI